MIQKSKECALEIADAKLLSEHSVTNRIDHPGGSW